MVTTSMTRATLTVVLTIVSVLTGTSTILTDSNVVPPVSAQNVSSPLFIDQVKVTREISAPIDKIWSIVSNVDEETKYWPIIKDIWVK